MHKLNYSSKAK